MVWQHPCSKRRQNHARTKKLQEIQGDAFSKRRDADFARIVVQRTTDNEWTAIAREAGVVGEILVSISASVSSPLRYPVRVLESRPVIIEGTVRHQLRLQVQHAAVGR